MRTAISSIKADSKHDFINGWPDHKSRTVALITADRILAQRVAIELQQFDIIIDDSAGISLGQTSPGGILRLTARLGDNNISALELLAALKHPLSSGGETSEDFASFIKDFEAKIVRNSRLSVGISKIRNILNNSKLNKKVMTWTLGFLEQLSRFNNEFNKKEKIRIIETLKKLKRQQA